ncbi:histidine kinase [Pseudofrankia sp. BMG5.37]|uniref:sensor histidine kinase n=1 Tax=Pseudofrankia sp. BMG5.37 TaxID=3050035 RepID=UPI0028945F1E|nr:histidine kinase [Pseudofrankia sp. BMG5.37]MDT3442687.1 histidine kinase [Pseudofrankia sp. BMG5.37]
MPRAPGVVATLLAGCTWATAAGVEPFATVDSPAAVGPAGVAVSLTAVLTCWAPPRRPEPASVGLAIVAAVWLAGSLQGLQGLTDPVMAVALASPVLAQVGFAVVLDPARRWSVAVALFTVLAFVVHLAGYQPLLDPGCLSPCADLSAPLADRLGARFALGAALVPDLCAATLVVGLACRGHGRALVRAGVAASAVAFAVADVMPWWRWGELTSTPLPDQVRTAAVALVTAVVLVAVLRRWQARRDLAVLARQLDNGSGIRLRGVRDVHFAVPGSSRWVDVDGLEVNAEAGAFPAAVVLTGRDGEPAVRLVAASRAHPDLTALPPTLRLALDNARLDVMGRVRLADLRASQARIVATADAERRRIERDLHDGAQQRLVGAAIHLSAARNRLPDAGVQAVRRIQALIHDALAGLRDISHGALLGVLGAEGLEAAIEDLVDFTDLEVDLTIGDLPSLAAPVERAAYGVVAAGLAIAERGAAAGPASVRVGVIGDSFTVVVRITMNVSAADRITDASDRVGATGGIFIVDNDAHTTWLTGVWLCAS